MPYRSLNADHIVKTLRRLKDRIDERFPGRGLGAVAGELLVIAEQDSARARRITRPYLWVRGGVAAFFIAGIAVQAFIFRSVRLRFGVELDALELFQGIEAALNTLILMGVGVFFLTTVEERMKRRSALKDLHELRSIAHVIDMHQLTKDPTSILNRGDRTKASPTRDMSEFELTRYLDYCAEMLSLTGKLSALYAQNTRDGVVIQAVNEIETLTASFAGKIWQKIVIIQNGAAASGASAPAGLAAVESGAET
jgi:hypothetical protein